MDGSQRTYIQFIQQIKNNKSQISDSSSYILKWFIKSSFNNARQNQQNGIVLSVVTKLRLRNSGIEMQNCSFQHGLLTTS